MLNLAIILGTRPEIIKTWSIIRFADQDPDIECILVHTGQHYDYEMAQIFFEDLKIREPDLFLRAQGETHGTQTAAMLTKIEEFLLKEDVDVVGVLGDTNSALAGALASQKLGIPTAHFEAGCRSYDRKMPEEINRLMIDAISSILFAPSQQAEINLLWEGKPRNRIFMCGNTQKDVLQHTIQTKSSIELPQGVKPPYGVITIHRAENTDNLKRLKEIITGIINTPILLVFPIHPRTKKQLAKLKMENDLQKISQILLIPPIGYNSFINLLSKAHFVLTDSGGIQEEAAMLNIPCVTLRDTSEWPETVIGGKNLLVGHNNKLITKALHKLNHDEDFFQKMSKDVKLFEADAGRRIITVMKKLWGENRLYFGSVNMMDTGYPMPFLSSNKIHITQQNVLFETLAFKNDGSISHSDPKYSHILQLIGGTNEFDPETALR
ncbi:MAG: non-hydrolyzing UDP-N-acetylglucosamine 2-epimerase [Candidatus Hodarchaeales archaeon]